MEKASLYYVAIPIQTLFSCKNPSREGVRDLALEKCRPRHSHPEASQGGVREVAMIGQFFVERVSKMPPERNPEASKIEERVVDGE